MRFPASHPLVLPVAAAGVRQNPFLLRRHPGCCAADGRTVFAPGEYVISSFPGNKYGYTTGASAATAFVSAAAAVLSALRPAAAPGEIRDSLFHGARTFRDEDGSWRFLSLGGAASRLLGAA